MIRDTSEDTASKLFYKLPTEIREQKSLTSFCTNLKAEITRRAKDRLCPLTMFLMSLLISLLLPKLYCTLFLSQVVTFSETVFLTRVEEP